MIRDMTAQAEKARAFYDKLLDEKIKRISELSGVPAEKMLKINPVDLIEKNKFQEIRGHEYKRSKDFIEENKKDDNFLISPLDDDEKTANQIAYKERVNNTRIRGSKCKLILLPTHTAKLFFLKNHRQSPPNLRATAFSYGLLYQGELVGVMTYDKADGAVRGNKGGRYELLRLAFAPNISIAGGASKLQKHCEELMRAKGETEIFSYSNATINSGGVYKALNFEDRGVSDGQPFVIMEDFSLKRLVSLHPYSTDASLAKFGRIKTHIGGNKMWVKEI